MCDESSSRATCEVWRRALAEQWDGDHAAAELHFAEVAVADPSDAEARFQQAVEAGWSAPAGSHRFDEVLVGIAVAIERATPKAREALRRRGARALTVLAEMRFARSQDGLLDTESASNEALVHHIMLGGAVLRLLDSALELDPRDTTASEAIIRTCDDLLARVNGKSGLRIAGLGFVAHSAPIAGEGIGRARERALRHLAAMAREARCDEEARETLPSSARETSPGLHPHGA